MAIVKRKIKGREYLYETKRVKGKVVAKYIGPVMRAASKSKIVSEYRRLSPHPGGYLTLKEMNAAIRQSYNAGYGVTYIRKQILAPQGIIVSNNTVTRYIRELGLQPRRKKKKVKAQKKNGGAQDQERWETMQRDATIEALRGHLDDAYKEIGERRREAGEWKQRFYTVK